MTKRTWKAGRKSICPQSRAIITTFSVCPNVKEALHEYCRQTGFLTSQVVNWAIMSYIEQDKFEETEETKQ